MAERLAPTQVDKPLLDNDDGDDGGDYNIWYLIGLVGSRRGGGGGAGVVYCYIVVYLPFNNRSN